MKAKRIYATMAVIGFLLILGTAGASDLDNISLPQAMVQAVIGLVLFATGVIRGRAYEK